MKLSEFKKLLQEMEDLANLTYDVKDPNVQIVTFHPNNEATFSPVDYLGLDLSLGIVIVIHN